MHFIAVKINIHSYRIGFWIKLASMFHIGSVYRYAKGKVISVDEFTVSNRHFALWRSRCFRLIYRCLPFKNIGKGELIAIRSFKGVPVHFPVKLAAIAKHTIMQHTNAAVVKIFSFHDLVFCLRYSIAYTVTIAT